MKRAPVDIPPISKEVVLQAGKLTNPEARFLVSQYYDMQNMRKRADMQIRHLGDKVLPTLLQYTADSAAMIEAQLVKGLKNFAESDPVGLWMLAQDGVGPVIAAGMLAHLDIEKARPPDISGASPALIRRANGRKARSALGMPT